MKKEDIFQNIRAYGGRITKIKKVILQLLIQKKCFVSQAEIFEHLQKKGLVPNRSTIFRELLHLVKNNILLKNTISGTDYYELACHHHHHVICLGCNKIEKIETCNHLAQEEKIIAHKNNFNILNHSLAFFGYCQKCQVQKI